MIPVYEFKQFKPTQHKVLGSQMFFENSIERQTSIINIVTISNSLIKTIYELESSVKLYLFYLYTKMKGPDSWSPGDNEWGQLLNPDNLGK